MGSEFSLFGFTLMEREEVRELGVDENKYIIGSA
jgi:hypothetical protein